MTIVIAGGSGFLGRNLTRRLESAGHRVLILTRRPSAQGQVQWRPDGTAGDLPRHLNGVDAVVNLAGEGIADRRWTKARKAAVQQSRVLSTRTLARALGDTAKPPRVFISGSGVGYYGPRGGEAVTESMGPGSDFLARVCVEWEQEARAIDARATRLAIVRGNTWVRAFWCIMWNAIMTTPHTPSSTAR